MLEGKLTQAEPLIAAAVAADPRNIRYLSTKAELESFQRRYGDALATLAQLERREPANPEFRYQSALVYTSMYRYSDAKNACRSAIALAPNFAQAYFLLGAIEFDRGAPRMAEDAFRRAVDIEPAFPLYHSAAGAALFKAGDLVDGVKELDRALQLDPQTISAYYWRALASLQQGQADRAIRDLETFVTLDPNYPDAYRRLADLYATWGQSTKATAATAKYVALKKSGHKEEPFFITQLGLARLQQIRKVNHQQGQ